MGFLCRRLLWGVNKLTNDGQCGTGAKYSTIYKISNTFNLICLCTCILIFCNVPHTLYNMHVYIA